MCHRGFLSFTARSGQKVAPKAGMMVYLRLMGLNSILFVVSLALGLSPCGAQERSRGFETGDLIFQDLDCGPMCDAIEAVTEGYGGRAFSHVGLVTIDREKGDTLVIEAIGAGVVATPLKDFLARSPHEMYVGRLKERFAPLIPGAVGFALRQLGKPYDDAFIYGNDKFYCSELIYDAFKAANQGEPVFELEPMTFKKPGSDDFFPVWVDYYARLGLPIPEGEPGCNPGGLSRSAMLDISKAP